jgi:hypothetical protein
VVRFVSRFLLIAILTLLGACALGAWSPGAGSTGIAPSDQRNALAERGAGSDDPGVGATPATETETEASGAVSEPSEEEAEDGLTLGAGESSRSVPAVPLLESTATAALVEAAPRSIHRETPTRPPRG